MRRRRGRNEITIVFEGKAHKATITASYIYVFYWTSAGMNQNAERHDRLGITWERGWDTPEARALMTPVALSC